ncbi:MAG: YbhB/YbcL family Raf kinase inhibitor-like protein [Patescibacteria group bacterium]
MEINIPVLEEDKKLPSTYTCDGEGESPHLEIKDVPQEAKSLALIVDDPDAPAGTFTHWLVWNIPVTTKKIEKGQLPVEAIEGVNSGGKVNYYPPCPPQGEHRYRFILCALDNKLDLPKGTNRTKLEKKLEKHTIETTQLTTKYQRA